ncbi:MAG: integrase arm-type DNA-binding domain-containing protein, partial [Pseudomonadota bacterium]
MPKVAFRETSIRDLPRDRKADYSVTGEPGLYVRVLADGSLRWFFLARKSGGGRFKKVREKPLVVLPNGRPCQTDMEAARRWARELHLQCRGGEDPKAVAEAEARKAAMDSLTVGDLWDLYSGPEGDLQDKAEGTRNSYDQMWRIHLRGPFGTRKARDVKPDEILRELKKIDRKCRSAVRAKAALSAVFAFGVSNGHVPSNPCYRLGFKS